MQLERIKADRRLSDQDLLRSTTLDMLPPCYSFVQIEPYAVHAGSGRPILAGIRERIMGAGRGMCEISG